ncbi:MAG: sulfite exporter TauE/SafE family protein [Bryobacteraceae bacterium]
MSVIDLKISLAGAAVGLLVGLTGMGGGAVMTPMLILLGWARPLVAVGTDLVWSAITKSVGSFVHYRQGTVDIKLVKRLALGSLPGALAGILLLMWLQRRGFANLDRLIVRVLGVALIAVAVSLLLRSLKGIRERTELGARSLSTVPRLITALGAVVGFLVSLTSVGSGSLIVACLVVMCPAVPLKRIIGSDIFHALLLVGVSAIGHLGIGTVNFGLLLSLLVGSIPGVWIGSKLSAVFPEKVLRPVLGSTLLFLGYKLL